MADNRALRRAACRLAEILERGGYMRVPSLERRAEGARRYKKGWELRFVCRNHREVSSVRRWLERAGLRPGEPFPKHSAWVQPLYGRKAVERLFAFVQSVRPIDFDTLA